MLWRILKLIANHRNVSRAFNILHYNTFLKIKSLKKKKKKKKNFSPVSGYSRSSAAAAGAAAATAAAVCEQQCTSEHNALFPELAPTDLLLRRNAVAPAPAEDGSHGGWAEKLHPWISILYTDWFYAFGDSQNKAEYFNVLSISNENQ